MFIGLIFTSMALFAVAGSVCVVGAVMHNNKKKQLRAEAKERGERDPSALSPFTVVLVLLFTVMVIAGIALKAQGG